MGRVSRRELLSAALLTRHAAIARAAVLLARPRLSRPRLGAETVDAVMRVAERSIMLILSRKIQEALVVGGAHGLHRAFKVTVLEVRGRKVKLGIEADADIPIRRSEVLERVRTCLETSDEQ
jgi:carbon storage regulator CsrA